MKISNSEKAFNRSKKSLAGGIASGGRLAHQPLFIQRAQGSHAFDIDGKEYIDYMLAFGPLILGHAPKVIINAVQNRMTDGMMYGTGCEEEYLLAEEVVNMVPCAELVRFTNSGTESVQAALRLSRAFTGRDKIIKFEGHFHGWADNIYISVKPEGAIGLPHSPWAQRSTAGQPESVLKDVCVLPFNNLDAVADCLEQNKGEIAAIILEPMTAYNGCIEPVEGYLEGLRALSIQHKVILIFDEVVTGFRLGLGGAQEYYGVIPDLFTFGKAFAGGLPIAGFGGKKEIMELLENNIVHHLGTYNANPICAAGALATLHELKRDQGFALRHISTLGKTLMKGFKELFLKYSLPFNAVGPGPIFTIISPSLDLKDYRDTLKYNSELMQRFHRDMLNQGVWFMGRGTFMLSAAHTAKDITNTLNIASDVLSRYNVQ